MNVDCNVLGTSIIYAKQYIICIMEIVSGIHQNTIQPPECPVLFFRVTQYKQKVAQ
jgi:hypothetical protein